MHGTTMKIHYCVYPSLPTAQLWDIWVHCTPLPPLFTAIYLVLSYNSCPNLCICLCIFVLFVLLDDTLHCQYFALSRATDEWVHVIGGMILARENWSTKRQVPICPPQMPHRSQPGPPRWEAGGKCWHVHLLYCYCQLHEIIKKTHCTTGL
jgi:hypothetical protein